MKNLKNKLNYEEILEGMVLPEVKKGPIIRQQLVDYASSSGDYNKLHYDECFAKKFGISGCIAHGMLVMAMVGSYIKNWAKGGNLKNFKIRFVGMTNENDFLTFKGKVVKKYEENNENLIQIEVSSETQNKVTTTQGSAIIAL
jgi:acyl dehydratase